LAFYNAVGIFTSGDCCGKAQVIQMWKSIRQESTHRLCAHVGFEKRFPVPESPALKQMKFQLERGLAAYERARSIIDRLNATVRSTEEANA